MFVCTNAKKSAKKIQQMIDREREREREKMFSSEQKKVIHVIMY